MTVLLKEIQMCDRENFFDLVIIPPDPPSLAHGLIARMLDLEIGFPFEAGYRLPKTIGPEMSGAKLIVAPLEREDLEIPPGVRVIRFSASDWANSGRIERLPLQGGLGSRTHAFFAKMDRIPLEEQIAPLVRRIFETKISRWSDVERYHLECLLLGSRVLPHLFPRDRISAFVRRLTEQWPQRVQSCDEVAVTYPLMEYAHGEGDADLIRRCQLLMDDFLENSFKSFGVYGNFTSPHEAGIARAEIAFQVCPALARLSELLDMPHYGRICAEQMESLDRLLSDEETGLWYLGYGESGRSASLWARGCAFLLRALADLLPRNSRALPAWSAAKFQSLCAILGRLQGPGGGFHQILDEPDTRLETSATAWIAACLFKGMSHGLLDATHKPVAEAALGFVQRRLWDGLSSSLCGATTVSQDKAYYRSRPFLTATYGHFALLALLERAFHVHNQPTTRPGDA